jgi:cytochrome c oxidase cbb3-type subunit III
MSEPSSTLPENTSNKASQLVVLGMLSLIAAGGIAIFWLYEPLGPPPPEVARDPLLMEGRLVYFARCASCHRNDGQGEPPGTVPAFGPPVQNLTDAEWKHGDRPEQVLKVITEGSPNTRMSGWGRILDPGDIRAVAAYVYYLGKRPIPEELRKPR